MEDEEEKKKPISEEDMYQNLLKDRFDPNSEGYQERQDRARELSEERKAQAERLEGRANLNDMLGGMLKSAAVGGTIRGERVVNPSEYDDFSNRAKELRGRAGGLSELEAKDDLSRSKQEDESLYNYLTQRREQKRHEESLKAMGAKTAEERRQFDIKNAPKPKTPAEAFEELPVESQEEVKATAKSNASRKSLLSSLKGKLEEFDNAEDEDLKVSLGNQMLKTLNSDIGKDAVGAEEAKRLGAFLQYKIANFTGPGSFIGRDLDKFSDQARATISGQEKALKMDENEIDKLYGRQGRNKFDNVAPGVKPEGGTALAAPSKKSIDEMSEEEMRRELGE